MDLYLIRHAEPESGDDPVLATNGKEQAKKLGDMFVRINEIHQIQGSEVRVLTSKKRRTLQTAVIIHTKLHVPTALNIFSAPSTSESSSGDVRRLMTQLRGAASGPIAIPSGRSAKQIILVWHHPNVGAALNWLVGNNSLEWPDIYGATAYVECSDSTFGQGTGTLRWFILPELLPAPVDPA